MELGKARLRKVGINNLHCAVHAHHGVIWTDGKAIYLAPLHVDGKQVQNATSVRLGQFENVTSVHWSCCAEGEGACYLCVVHQHNVTVWRVSGVLPKLTFKQIRKINVRPIAQGCLWNPINDTLALLSRHQCSFYFQHDSHKGSYALPPLETGKISCGCWSTDGKKLIVSIGSALLIYRWSDLNASVSDFVVTAWRVPTLEGEITSISPMPKNCLVVATELPLESLCRKQDAFIVPDTEKEKRSSDDVIRPTNRQSATESLMNLQTNSQVMKESSSILTLIKFHEEAKEPTKISSAPLKGVLTPDILLYEKSSQCVVVGSNSQSQLHIYALLDKHLAYCGDIQLDKSQRPKGLCSMPTYFDERGAALLILVGQRDGEDDSFLSSSVEAEFQVSLKYIIIKPGYEGKSRQRGAKGDSLKKRPLTNSRGASLSKSESMREHRPSALSSDAQARVRSGSNAARMSTPVLTTAESDGPQLLSSPPTVESVENPLPEDSQQAKTSSPKTQDLTLDRLTSPPAQRTNAIQEITDQALVPPENLEVERTPFSSQSPQFTNNTLTQRYDLGGKDGNRPNAQPNQNGSTRNSNNTRLKDSPRRGSNSREDATGPRPILIKSPSDQIDEVRGLRGEHPALVKSSSDQIVRDNLRSPLGILRELQSDHQASGRLKGAWEVSGTDYKESQVQPYANSVDRSTSDETDGKRRKSSPVSLSSHHAMNGPQRNGRIDPQDESHQSLSQGPKEDASSDLGSSRHSPDTSFDTMEKQVKTQRSSIEALQRRLEELTSTVEECCCVFPNKYQDMQAPELVEIQYVNSNKQIESKKFLLDNGRLQLEPIRLAFNLLTVELLLDDVPVVLSSNIDGYIPMKFSPDSILRVSGQPNPKK